MFEKEAEEIMMQKVIKENDCIMTTCKTLEDCQLLDFCFDDMVDAFKDGAEFGYNKANEWHYVKDGDLPKENQECYFIYSNTYDKSNKVSFEKDIIQVRTGIYSFFFDQETGEETTEPCFYDDINDDEIGLSEVYAWKEIVLPEFPKENE